MTLLSVMAYHSFSGEVEASNTPTIRRLTPSCRHQLPRIAPTDACQLLSVRVRVHGLVARFLAHDLFRKPVPIPDHAEDMLFWIMRQPGNAVSTSLTQYEVPIGMTSSLKL